MGLGQLASGIAALLLTSLAAACGAPAEQPARFSTWSEAERRDALAASLGGVRPLAYGVVALAVDAASDGASCVTQSLDVPTVRARFAAGCTDPAGLAWRGGLEASNVHTALTPYDASLGRVAARFDALRVEGRLARLDLPGPVVTLDGTYEERDAAGGGTTIEQHLRLDGRLQLDLITRCDGRRCASEADAAGALERDDAIDTFTIRVASDADDELRPHGTVELAGAETLRLDLDASTRHVFADGRRVDCAPMTVDGAPAGTMCWDEGLPAYRQTAARP